MDQHFTEWAGSPILHLALLSMGLGLCLYLFLTLKRDIFRLDRRSKHAESGWKSALADHHDYSESSLKRHRDETAELRNDLKEIAERVSLLTPSAPPANGINLAKRTQVLQLARRGNRPDQIAACLQVPQNEVDLVLKVQRTMAKAF